MSSLTPRLFALVLGLLFSVSGTVRAEVRLAAVFADHMVLQRDICCARLGSRTAW